MARVSSQKKGAQKKGIQTNGAQKKRGRGRPPKTAAQKTREAPKKAAEEKTYEIEYLMGHRFEKEEILFIVKWRRHAVPTEEPIASFAGTSAEGLLRQYCQHADEMAQAGSLLSSISSVLGTDASTTHVENGIADKEVIGEDTEHGAVEGAIAANDATYEHQDTDIPDADDPGSPV